MNDWHYKVSWGLKIDTEREGSDYKATRVTDCMPEYKYKNNCNVRYFQCLCTNLSNEQNHVF